MEKITKTLNIFNPYLSTFLKWKLVSVGVPIMFYLLKVYSVVSLGLMQCSREDATYIKVYQYIGQWFLFDETYIKGIENSVDVHLNEYMYPGKIRDGYSLSY